MAEFESVTLKDPTSSVTATFVPVAGMVGIPILYPWANRLSASKYGINGAVVTLTPGTGGVRTDEHGVPIHGVLAAYPGWLVTARSEKTLTAVCDFGGKPRLLASFPFPHVLTQSVTLE